LKAFDGRIYTPCGILSNLQIELGGKIVTVEVEVVDGPLNYNILLGRTWVYAMVVWFQCTFVFLFKGGIIVIDQLTFFANSS